MITRIVIAFLLCSPLYLGAQTQYLHCGHLIDVEKMVVLGPHTIVVQNDRIAKVESDFLPVPDTATRIDLTDKVVLPGLFDMHVHIESETSKDHYIKRFTLNEADIAFRAAQYAKTTLLAGFTTVRDLGGTGVNTSLRDAIADGYVPGPRIFSCGKSIATTGGHADPTNGYKADLMGDPGPNRGVANSPEEARKAVRQRYKNGADVIKITATGGVLSLAKSGHNPQFFEDELQAIVATAKDYEMLTAAHAHGDEGMQRAIRAGIKTIEHGTMMSEETMALMKEYDTYYVPTITAGKSVAELAEIEGYYPAPVVPKAKAIGPKIQSTFAKAYKNGVKIAFGTDAGVFPHGQNAKEFQYMLEAGMPVLESIHCATIVPARLLRVEEDLGSIQPGKIADIIALDTLPTEDVTTLQRVSFVMKEGKIYKEE